MKCGKKWHKVRPNDHLLSWRHYAGGCTHPRRVYSFEEGVCGPSWIYKHWGSSLLPTDSAFLQVEVPLDLNSGSIQNLILMEY